MVNYTRRLRMYSQLEIVEIGQTIKRRRLVQADLPEWQTVAQIIDERPKKTASPSTASIAAPASA